MALNGDTQISSPISPAEEIDDLGRYDIVQKSGLSTFWSQLSIMLRRNTILQIRWFRSTLSQFVVAPFVFMILLYVLQQADYANQGKANLHPGQAPLQGIQRCQGPTYGSPCVTIMYTPADPIYTGFMSTFAAINGPRMGDVPMVIESAVSDPGFFPARQMDIVPVPNADYIYNFTLYHPNYTSWGIVFNYSPTPNPNYQYQIWYNSTQVSNGSDIFGRDLTGFMRGIDEAIITNLNDPTATVKANISVDIRDWPVIPPSTLSDSIVQNLGPVFFFCSVMVIFINVLNQIVSEKEAKQRHGMEMMGLKPSFFLFGDGMVMFAFFITTFVRKARVAVLIGIFVFVIGLLFESFVFGTNVLGYIWWDASTSPAGWIVLMFFPFFNFGKIFLDITTYTTGRLDSLTNTYIPGPGFNLTALTNPIPIELRPTYGGGSIPNVPAPVQSWYFLLMNIAFYALLTWYFDTIIPNEFGMSLPWHFPFLASYWGIETGKRKGVEAREWLEKEKKKTADVKPPANEEDAVAAERVQTLSEDYWPAVKIVNLRKVFPTNPLGFKSTTDKIAVDDLCLTFKEGEVFALLGQNGAGKSTSINILSGLTPSTTGDCLIYGLSARNQMHRIRRIMGVCPQHDILFDDLTAREHIRLYAGLKGVPSKSIEALVQSRLTAVRLLKVADQRAGSYSGGMKRRLSMVIATIGDPKVVYLDEPTTGMDPVNRRHVWTFIEKFKKNRVVVLTTHSMEEADVLADRIGIMARGQLKAIGSSIALKTKYGAGYRISVVTDASRVLEAKQKIQSQVPDAILEDESAGAMIFQFPPSSTPAIPAFVKYLDSQSDSKSDGLVRAWSISNTSLEEVFLKLLRDGGVGTGGADSAATKTLLRQRMDRSQ
ncbi:hypothetical protein SmJEL517_g03814 [Synchytrium microbalum]|uniref:ABC transporter domain-containing protein n=1 Tax=Synchytrium microbalum TaxID=1806994 RepID=A0A507C5B8_9FUNG|nr:uncharacterized protein SmJEL517_g03814 [Synchytrium microbalum]TPX33176.1 hypothetical protein SmJEL517_g03814 [Synchytrium microbalum]